MRNAIICVDFIHTALCVSELLFFWGGGGLGEGNVSTAA